MYYKGISCSTGEGAWSDTIIICEVETAGNPMNEVLAVIVPVSYDTALYDLTTTETTSQTGRGSLDITSVSCGSEGCFADITGNQRVIFQGTKLGWEPAEIKVRGRSCWPVTWTNTGIECDVDMSRPPTTNYVVVWRSQHFELWDLVSGTQDPFAGSRAQITSINCGGAACTEASTDITIQVWCEDDI